MRTETMIAGAVAAASFYNAYATPFNIAFLGGTDIDRNLPHLPSEFLFPSVLVGLGATVAFVWLGVEDIANAARENPHRRFEPMKI